MPTLGEDTERMLREVAPQVLGSIVRRYRDFAAAEDAVQEALAAAAIQWPKQGVPANPRGWLVRVALRRMVDHVRSEAARRHREEIVVSLVPAEDQLVLAADEGAPPDSRDDTLEMLFLCCHPALSPASAIALTLRAVGGLTTAEIAKAFLVPEATMAQRISRAKQRVKDSHVPFATRGDDVATRLGSVMQVLYLIFNEGYAGTSGRDVVRTDLSKEALRLARMLHRLVPDESEVAGLLALLLLTDARREARTGPAGQLVPLDRQDRTRWDHNAITEGQALLERAFARGTVGPYQLQAAIAALHDEAPSTDETDWPQILALYGILDRMSDNPMVALNLAIATAMVHGPAAGLTRLDALERDARIQGHYRLDAVRAHLLERAGNREAAAVAYRRAAERTASIAERDYLLVRASEVARDSG
jgi:RNA polymerase sigma factor (sigma-70 family)